MDSKKPHIVNLESLETLFREHYTYLCTSAYYVVGDREAAHDIVQDFFHYCWRKRRELTITQEFRSYAFRAVKNASLNYLTREKKNERRLPANFEEATTDPQLEKEAETDVEIRNRALWETIDRLPAQRRLIFLLSNRDGLSYLQIATKLNISVNTVKTQIKLAYQFLRNGDR